MEISLLAFASVADVLGERERRITLPDGCTVAGLKETLEAAHTALQPMWEGLAIAVNGELGSDERQLREGDEVALLPPVSGGAPPASGSAGEPERLVEAPIDINAVRSRIEDSSCGAVVLFLGNVRDSHADRRVEGITYSAYRSMAAKRLATIERELEASFDGARLAIVHRLGHLEVGDTSVVIGASSPHRGAAYEASRIALERLKAEVPIWKKEHYADGDERWREEEPLASFERRTAT